MSQACGVRDVLAAQLLIEAVICDRFCWIVPRDSAHLQAEEAYADPGAGWHAANYGA